MQIEVSNLVCQVRLNLHHRPLRNHAQLVHYADLSVAAAQFVYELELTNG